MPTAVRLDARGDGHKAGACAAPRGSRCAAVVNTGDRGASARAATARCRADDVAARGAARRRGDRARAPRRRETRDATVDLARALGTNPANARRIADTVAAVGVAAQCGRARARRGRCAVGRAPRAAPAAAAFVRARPPAPRAAARCALCGTWCRRRRRRRAPHAAPRGGGGGAAASVLRRAQRVARPAALRAAAARSRRARRIVARGAAAGERAGSRARARPRGGGARRCAAARRGASRRSRAGLRPLRELGLLRTAVRRWWLELAVRVARRAGRSRAGMRAPPGARGAATRCGAPTRAAPRRKPPPQIDISFTSASEPTSLRSYHAAFAGSRIASTERGSAPADQQAPQR